jgi:hypothetical protein
MEWRSPRGRSVGGWADAGVSSRGNPYKLWVPAMPRISDEFLECVVYLYPDRGSAEVGQRAGGSGFIAGAALGVFEGIRQEDWAAPIIVTNSHVVRNENTAVRINTTDGGIEIFETVEHHWLFHPNHDLA